MASLATLWSSSNTNIFTVSNVDGEKGLLRPLKVGKANAKATDPATGKSKSVAITIVPVTLDSLDIVFGAPEPIVGVGYTTPFYTTAVYSDGFAEDVTAQTTFTSSAPSVLAFDPATDANVATGVSPGSATVNASFTANGTTVTASVPMSVVVRTLTGLVIQPNLAPLPKGLGARATATAQYNTGEREDVTEAVNWSSTTPAFTVSNVPGDKGHLQGVSIGGGSIKVVDAAGHVGMLPYQVVAAVPQQLVIPTADRTALLNLKANTSYTLNIQANFSDGTTGPLPASYSPVITVSPSTLATVNNATRTIHANAAPGNGGIQITLIYPPNFYATPAGTQLTVKP